MSGVCIRIAQKMGLHRDGESLGLSPYETEMRRRVWWHIVWLDFRSAVSSGFKPVSLPDSCDCKMPTNINDADFDINTKSTLQDCKGPTEMIVSLLICGLAQCLVDRRALYETMSFVEANIISPDARLDQRRITELTKFAREVEGRLNSIVIRYCDPAAGPPHTAALQIQAAITKKIWSMIAAPRDSVSDGSDAAASGDGLFRFSVDAAAQSAGLFQAIGNKSFLWFIIGHFEQKLFVYLVGQLCHRTSGVLVERAWELMPVIYHYNHGLHNLSTGSNAILAAFLTKAWRARQEALVSRLGYAPETPNFVLRTEQMLGSHGVEGSSLSSRNPCFSGGHGLGLMEPEAVLWELAYWGSY